MSRKNASASELCPCESGRPYETCCAPLHRGGAAESAEALMRSRYSAYALRLKLYLLASWHPSTRPAMDDLELDPTTKWLGLKIVDRTQTDEDHATVEFVARYRVGGSSAVRMQERSRFVREGGRWFYLDAEGVR
ncbi:hypothetical protein E4T66_13045 [Sinimarinibacterium sp. CAU 1509]|uniref:YchJ family protein n=1 Tax=Sinimarinibacterium sp. CAU 1509 TaxID=2562283 RepID=UPI0010AC5DFD|nr:YchJ family metal-binding protein [Sinimarinibacterium sp. CAU 1509]TJY59320.1 hypothetical protein E4T66_13045 [Sinimarinibacterium sp. CAU 1509]